MFSTPKADIEKRKANWKRAQARKTAKLKIH
jgi:hypothetical protein